MRPQGSVSPSPSSPWASVSALGLLTVIVSKFICVARDFDSIAVRIKKTNRTIAGNFQDFRTADDGNFSSFQYGVEFIDFLVRANINAEVMEFRNAVIADRFRPFGQLHER